MTLFESRLARIRTDTSMIEAEAGLLEHLGADHLVTPAYDLRASIRNLRAAADKLEVISNRSKDHAV